jgi:hypothetical protein
MQIDSLWLSLPSPMNDKWSPLHTCVHHHRHQFRDEKASLSPAVAGHGCRFSQWPPVRFSAGWSCGWSIGPPVSLSFIYSSLGRLMFIFAQLHCRSHEKIANVRRISRISVSLISVLCKLDEMAVQSVVLNQSYTSVHLI